MAQTRTRSPVALLHTADLHIDEGQASIAAMRAVIDIALAERVDLVLIAGDTFDHDQVSDLAARSVVTELARLTQPVVIIPGNHDPIDYRSIYQRVDLTEAGPHVYFIDDPAGRELIFPDLDVAIWARGIENHTPDNRPLAGYRPSDPRLWRIVLVHGFYVPAGESSWRSSQIHEEEIAALECDYLALGHVHRYWEVSSGSVTASYSGSATQDRIPGVNLVRLDEGFGVRLERQLLATVPNTLCRYRTFMFRCGHCRGSRPVPRVVHNGWKKAET
jgi:DNA repair exonuclease SbcCD nuclease subunit